LRPGVIGGMIRGASNMSEKRYSIGRLPASRKGIIDYLGQADKSHSVSALFDFDVTEIRSAVRAWRRLHKKPLSLSVYFLYLYVRAIGQVPVMQRAVYKRNRYVDFDDVDCAVLVERRIDGRPSATTRIIRAAQDLSLEGLMDEIDDAVRGEDAQLFSGRRKFDVKNLAAYLPRFLRVAILRHILHYDPTLKKKMFGTVSFTAVSMFAQGNGWAVSLTPHPANFILGGIATQPRYIGGELIPRDILSATLTFNHDLIDGAEATRFINILKKLAGKLYGLEEVRP
jgi:pyruvate/2-oxoglutarate dehydrogenase complex dihydrolipoamide acyltransferase (E2) component